MTTGLIKGVGGGLKMLQLFFIFTFFLRNIGQNVTGRTLLSLVSHAFWIRHCSHIFMQFHLSSSKAHVCSIPHSGIWCKSIISSSNMLLARKLPRKLQYCYLLILYQLFNSMWVVPNTFNTRIKNSVNSSFLYVIFHSHRDQSVVVKINVTAQATIRTGLSWYQHQNWAWLRLFLQNGGTSSSWCELQRQKGHKTPSTLAYFTKHTKCMTLSVLETSLPMQRSHDILAILAFGIWSKNWGLEVNNYCIIC